MTNPGHSGVVGGCPWTRADHQQLPLACRDSAGGAAGEILAGFAAGAQWLQQRLFGKDDWVSGGLVGFSRGRVWRG